MVVRFLRMQTKVNLVDKAVAVFESSVVPECSDQPGFVGASFLVNRKTGECIPMTYWEKEEDMLASEKNRFFQEQVSKFIGFFQTPPVREVYEVAFKT